MKKGFTLPELLVAVAILTFMVSVILTSTRNLTTMQRVNAAAGVVLDTTKEARSNAISVKQFLGNLYPSYGVHLETANTANTRVTMYADCIANDSSTDAFGTCVANVPDLIIDACDSFKYVTTSTQCNGGNGLVKHVPFADQNIRVKRIRATYPSGAGMGTFNEASVDILFLRPEPTIWISTPSAGLVQAGSVEVVVGDRGNRFERSIVFYTTGQFYVSQ